MTEALHAVLRRDNLRNTASEPYLIGVFSNEGMARTHAAKLRMLGEYDTEYLVEPVAVDKLANQEPIYYASATLELDFLTYEDKDIDLALVNVADSLPPCDIDVDNQYALVSFTEYGWSKKHAAHRLKELMDMFIAKRKDKLDEEQAAELQRKQVAAETLRQSASFLKSANAPEDENPR